MGRLLKDPARLKEDIRAKWESYCVEKIGKGIVTPLNGELLAYFEDFNFSIFEDRTGAELIAEHAETVFYAPRFGGGLPPRVQAPAPPTVPDATESLYLRKLLDADADHLGQDVPENSASSPRPDLPVR